MSKMRNVHDKHDNSIDRVQSPLVKFCVTATSCIMIACVSICILLFKTDTIMDIDTSLDNVKLGSYNRTSVETVMNQLNKEEPEPAGDSALTPPENPNVPGVTGTDKASELIRKMQSLGYNTFAICGAIGNFIGESGLDPSVTQGHVMDGTSNDAISAWVGPSGRAIGFAQWDGSRAVALVNGAKSSGVNWYDWDYQVRYYLNELSSNSCDVNTFNSNASSLENAVFWFAHKFERPGISSQCPGYNRPNKYCASQISFSERTYINGWSHRMTGATDCLNKYFGG